MQKLSTTQKDFLREATLRYASSLPGSPVEGYLESRGIASQVEKFRLGYVEDPLPGHDMYKGMLAIPYLRPSWDDELFVASIRFGCIEKHEHTDFYHGKYNTLPGDRPRMYNTQALLTTGESIAICEGETDTITAEMCGIPAVGIPGIQLWKKHFREPFLGYETVYVLADGDDAGRHMASVILKDLTNAKHIPMPAGKDVNKVYELGGARALTERIK